MRLEEIRPRRINKKQQVYELLRHEATALVYNLYVRFRKLSKQFSIHPSLVLPSDSIYEYVELLESTYSFIVEREMEVPHSINLLKDLLEYLDNIK